MNVNIAGKEYQVNLGRQVVVNLKKNKVQLGEILSGLTQSNKINDIDDDSFIIETENLFMSGSVEGNEIELDFAGQKADVSRFVIE